MKLLKQPWFIIALFLIAVYGYYLSDSKLSLTTPVAIASEAQNKNEEATKKEPIDVNLSKEYKLQDVQALEVSTYQNLNISFEPGESQSIVLTLKGKGPLYKNDGTKLEDWFEVKSSSKKLSLKSFKNGDESFDAKKLKELFKNKEFSGEKLELTVTFPKTHNFKKITVASVSSKVSAKGVNFNEMTLDSVSGDVQFSQGKGGNISVNTVSGTILANDMDVTKAAFKSVSGDANIKALVEKPNFSFESVSGDLKVSLPTTASVNVKFESMTGELQNEFGSGPEDAGQLNISSLSGDASVVKTK